MLTLVSALSRITVSLRRLKHFDCKEKHALLVGGGLALLILAALLSDACV